MDQEILKASGYTDNFIKRKITAQTPQCSHNIDIVCTTSTYPHWTERVILAKYWLWLPDDGFLINRIMLEQPPEF